MPPPPSRRAGAPPPLPLLVAGLCCSGTGRGCCGLTAFWSGLLGDVSPRMIAQGLALPNASSCRSRVRLTTPFNLPLPPRRSSRNEGREMPRYCEVRGSPAERGKRDGPLVKGTALRGRVGS